MLKIFSKSAKKIFEISSITEGEITVTTERTGTPSKLDFTLLKEGGIAYLEGDRLDFSKNKNEIFSGYIFKKEKTDRKIKTTAYDQLFYLKQNKQSYNFENMTATGIIKHIAAEFNLIVDDKIADTKYVLPAKVYKDKNLLEIITDCVDRTNIATNKIYTFYDNFGKLTLKESKDMLSKIVISGRGLVENYTYTTSLEETYNYIKLVRKNKESGKYDTCIVKDDKSAKIWGKLQYFEEVDENLNPAQIQEKARQIFKFYGQKRRKLSLSITGIPELRAGSMVLVEIKDLGDISLEKILLIERCTHHFSAAGHTTDLEMEIQNG